MKQAVFAIGFSTKKVFLHMNTAQTLPSFSVLRLSSPHMKTALFDSVSKSRIQMERHTSLKSRLGKTIFKFCHNILWYAKASNTALPTYDAFGNLLSVAGPMAGVFFHRFSTKYFDPETGLYYYGYRFYSPEWGRWINRDPIEEEGGTNLYVFGENGPICVVDKAGKDLWLENTPSVLGFHQRVCVTMWTKDNTSHYCCEGVRYRKSGSYCISFGIDRNGNEDSADSFLGDGGSSDNDSLGNSSTSGNEATQVPTTVPFPLGFDGPNVNGDGHVYLDNGTPATKTAFFLSTDNNPCKDIEIFNYMNSLVGQRANYSIFCQNCRDFSQAVFNRYRKR